MSEEMKFSSSDKPVSQPKQDIFGYAHFAKTLADSLTKMDTVEGLVISINGPWGCGKTSVINFIKYFLDNEPDDKKPYIISFNPWLFTGQEDLIENFLSEMLSEIAPYTQLHAKLKDDLSVLAGIFSKGAKFIPLAGSAIETITDIAKEQLQKKPSLQKTKNKVADLLSEENRNLIVFIDDIDRLSSSEIRHLFGAIKSIANFPNVLYVLAFDEDVVCNALSKTQDLNGMSYLEKIVQMPFKLPLPDKESLYKFFSVNIDKILHSTDQKYLDINRWHNFYNGMFSHYLCTPRSIIRLLNTLRVTYPVVENEVNFVDFVAIEILRVFIPRIYDLIRENEDRFVLDRRRLGVLMEFNLDAIKLFYNTFLSSIDEKDKKAVEYCIVHLFPNVRDVLSGSKPLHELRDWRRDLRICSREHFLKYFKLTVPTDGIKNSSFQVFFDKLDDNKYISKVILGLLEEKLPDGKSRAAQYLDYLTDHIDESMPNSKAIGLMKALFDIGDLITIESDHDKSFIGFGTQERIGWLLYACCKKLNDEERVLVHKEAYSTEKSLSTKVLWFAHRLDEHDEEKQNYLNEANPPLLSMTVINELKPMIIDHIENASKSFALLDEKLFSLILFRWSKLTSLEKVQAFIDNVLKDNHYTLKFIRGFKSITRTAAEGAVIANNVLRIRIDWMKDFVDISSVYAKVNTLSTAIENDTDELNICLKQFFKEYEAYSKGIEIYD